MRFVFKESICGCGFLDLTLIKQVHALSQGFAFCQPGGPDDITLGIDAESFQTRVQFLLETGEGVWIFFARLRISSYNMQPFFNLLFWQSHSLCIRCLCLRQLPCVITSVGVHRPITKPSHLLLPRLRLFTLLKEEWLCLTHPAFLVDRSPFGIQHHL